MSYREPKLANITHEYRQDTDQLDASSVAYQSLHLEYKAEEEYFVLSTPRWAFDDVGELTAILRDFIAEARGEEPPAKAEAEPEPHAGLGYELGYDLGYDIWKGYIPALQTPEEDKLILARIQVDKNYKYWVVAVITGGHLRLSFKDGGSRPLQENEEFIGYVYLPEL